MLFHVNPSSGVPIYLQLEAQVKSAVATGALQRGAPLPPVRKVASQLAINPNTVSRAYQNLEREGVIATAAGGGSHVTDNGPGLLKSEKLRRLQPIVRQLAVEGRHLRLSQEDILKAVQEELESLGERE